MARRRRAKFVRVSPVEENGHVRRVARDRGDLCGEHEGQPGAPGHPGQASNRCACVALLLEAGADPNRRPTNYHVNLQTPLISAATCGFHDIVRLLLAAGADVNYTQLDDKTVLHVAVMVDYPNVSDRDNAECVRVLIDGGANVNVKRSIQVGHDHPVIHLTPFDDALYYGREHLFPVLLKGGASYTPSFDPIPGLGPGNYMSWPPPTFSSFPYLKKVDDAGGIKKYEKAHLARLVAMLVPKFPQLPAEIVPNIVMHWAHVGNY